ncbi:hypothetical protein [Chamaesiphon sp.]|uniref:hypothetical protein n=1 Tax=Chamaesiphon sp. TaxID=2814140 RepID=UPI0035936376
MPSHIFAQEFSAELKDEVVSIDNKSGDIIIKGRIFQQDPTDPNAYIDTELAGFLCRFPNEGDYWEFSGDGDYVWYIGTFAEVSKDLCKYWKPQPMSYENTILFNLRKKFHSIREGDLVSLSSPYVPTYGEVVAWHPEIEGQQEAFSYRSPNGIVRVTLEDWLMNMWEIKRKEELV